MSVLLAEAVADNPPPLLTLPYFHSAEAAADGGARRGAADTHGQRRTGPAVEPGAQQHARPEGEPSHLLLSDTMP